MIWYRWKFWRFAWSLNHDAAVIDGDGQWHPIVGRLMWLTYPASGCLSNPTGRGHRYNAHVTRAKDVCIHCGEPNPEMEIR